MDDNKNTAQPVKKQSWLTATYLKLRDATQQAFATGIATVLWDTVKKRF